MKRPNITPGPWHIGINPGPIVYGPKSEQVANMHVAMLPRDEHRANARAIAAVPALLEALELLTDTSNALCPVDHPAFSKARAALIAAGYQF